MTNSMKDRNDQGHDDPSESTANDRFIHGLLGYIHRDSVEEKERRIQDVFNKLESIDTHARLPQSYKLKRFIPLASAAMITLIAVVLFVITPQSNAYAIVNNVIQATQGSAVLRYEIRESNDESGFIGTLNIHGTRSHIQIKTPHGHDFVMGRDNKGEWSIRRDGTIERYDPRSAAPRWLNLGESTILIASLDQILIQLKDNYSIEIVSDKPNNIIQLNASRQSNIQMPGPDQISVWVDPESFLVDRLELSWIRRHDDRSTPPPGPKHDPDSKREPPNHPPPHHDPIEGHWFPELLGSPPMFDKGHSPPPPPLIIFQRVDPVEFPDQNYSPPTP